MADDWERRGVWIEARVSRAIVSNDGARWTLQAWAQWADGTYGTFSADFPADPGPLYRPGQPVAVLVDPQHRLRRYRIVLDPGLAAAPDRAFAMPADEPAVVGRLLRSPASPAGHAGPPRAAPRNEMPVWLACVAAAFVGLVGLTFWRAGGVLGGAIGVAAWVAAAALVGTALVRPVRLAALRRRGVRVPADVADIRQRAIRPVRATRLVWEVAATAASPAGGRMALVSEPLRDDPSAWCPPGSQVVALVDPKNLARYLLLLDVVTPQAAASGHAGTEQGWPGQPPDAEPWRAGPNG